VDIFFVLSGFLITSLLMQEWQRTGAIDLKRFYVRRALRLLPAFLLLLMVCWGYSYALVSPEEGRHLRKSVLVALCYLSNRFDFDFRVAPSLAHSWSLSVEEQFYLLWPLALGVLLWEKVHRRWILALTAGGIAASAVIRALVFRSQIDPLQGYYALETRADALLMGCLVGLLASWNLLPKSRGFQAVVRLGSFGAVGLIAYFVQTMFIWESFLYLGGFTLVAAAVAWLLVSLIISPPWLVRKILECPALAWVGRLSYGLYLWHWPILVLLTVDHTALIDHGNCLGMPSTGLALCVVGLSFLIATASFYGIEKPFLHLKGRFSSSTSRGPASPGEMRALLCAHAA
jgi:peptidoglycan/LPS O-acetylase OafA/YrhL